YIITHSLPTRRSSDLDGIAENAGGAVAGSEGAGGARATGIPDAGGGEGCRLLPADVCGRQESLQHRRAFRPPPPGLPPGPGSERSEEHTSELQSRENI